MRSKRLLSATALLVGIALLANAVRSAWTMIFSLSRVGVFPPVPWLAIIGALIGFSLTFWSFAKLCGIELRWPRLTMPPLYKVLAIVAFALVLGNLLVVSWLARHRPVHPDASYWFPYWDHGLFYVSQSDLTLIHMNWVLIAVLFLAACVAAIFSKS